MTRGSSPIAGLEVPNVPVGGTTRGRVIGCLVVFALSWCVFGVSARVIRRAPAWRTFEFCQYAEIGRNLVDRGAFETRLIEPMALAMIDRDRLGFGPGLWPVVNRYPLPAFAVAGWMSILGPTDLAAACSNGLAIALLATATYAAARSWLGAGWSAAVALLFLANPSFYGEFVLLGTPDVWFAAIFLLELLAWSSFDPADTRPRLAWAAGLGVLGGLAYLSRFNASVFLAVQAAILLRHRRWREVVAMALAAGAVASPMVAYNLAHFRRPIVAIYSTWNLLDRIGAYRVEAWLYYRVPDLPGELSRHLGGLLGKVSTNLFRVVPRGLWSLWRLEFILPMALVGPWFARRGTSVRRFAAWSIGLFALQLVLFSALRLEFEGRDSPHTGRYFFWFAAPTLILGVGTLARLSAGHPWARRLAVAAILAQLTVFGMAWDAMARWHLAKATSIGTDPIRRMLSEVVMGDRLLASNQPQISAWCCGLRSVSMPADPAELARLNLESPRPADYLFIDMSLNCIILDPRWERLVARDAAHASAWEAEILRDYEYVFPTAMTRPLLYVLLRRKGVPRSPLERRFSP